MLLETKQITKDFAGIRAVDTVSINIAPRELVGLIGPNGSGKTTLFNCVSGFLQPSSGKVYWHGEDITGMAPYRIALRGLTRTFQEVRVFSGMTVLESTLVSLQQHQGERILASFMNTASTRTVERKARFRALELLEFGDLSALKDEKCSNLSYGQQKILSFLCALMPSPDCVLLDEPTAGVNPVLIDKFKRQIRQLNQEGLAFLVIAHDMEFLMDLCERIIVLDNGRKIEEGPPDKVRNAPHVVEAYFGVE